MILGPINFFSGCLLIYHVDLRRGRGWQCFWAWFLRVIGVVSVGGWLGVFFLPLYWHEDCNKEGGKRQFHSENDGYGALNYFGAR